MKVFIERTNEYKETEAKTIKELLNQLKINPTTIIITKNNELIAEDSEIKENDEIKLLSVISGG